ncbi:MAG: tetratricopeptide repeat protein [Polyangiaceae bacterium]
MSVNRRAHSQASPPEASRLFQDGRAAFAQADYERASSYFEQSYQLDPALGTLLNLAVCEEKLGKLRAALSHLEQARDTADAADHRRPLVEERITQLDARIPRLTVRRSDVMDERVAISLDEKQLESSEVGATMRIDPGRHILDCSGPRGERCTNVFSLKEGESAVHIATVNQATPTIAPPPPATAQVPHPGAAPPRSDSRRSVAYATGAFGLAGVVVGLIAGGAVLTQKDVVATHCDRTGCDQRGYDAAQLGMTLSTISTISTAVGISALGVSTYLLVTAPASRGTVTGVSFVGTF